VTSADTPSPEWRITRVCVAGHSLLRGPDTAQYQKQQQLITMHPDYDSKHANSKDGHFIVRRNDGKPPTLNGVYSLKPEVKS
jgi:hypothetical protein